LSRTVAAIVLIMTRWHEDDLAGRLLAEADPKRGLDCGYSRENAELSNDINIARRTLFRHLLPRRPPARRAATTRTVQKTRSRFPKWDPPQTHRLPCEEVVVKIFERTWSWWGGCIGAWRL